MLCKFYPKHRLEYSFLSVCLLFYMLHSYVDRYHYRPGNKIVTYARRRFPTYMSIEQSRAVFQKVSKYLSHDISYDYLKISLVIIIGFVTTIFTELYLTL